jgi:hypothetical protein
MKVAVLFEDTVNLPAWFDSTITAALILCFPIALLLTWAFEMTPDGIKPAETADGEVAHSRRKRDIVIVADVLGPLALCFLQQMTKPDVVCKDKEGTVKAALILTQQPSIMVEPILQTDPSSIAVLPISNFFASGNHGYFSDGIAEELLNMLVRVDRLKAASRVSVFTFKSTDTQGVPLYQKNC